MQISSPPPRKQFPSLSRSLFLFAKSAGKPSFFRVFGRGPCPSFLKTAFEAEKAGPTRQQARLWGSLAGRQTVFRSSGSRSIGEKVHPGKMILNNSCLALALKGSGEKIGQQTFYISALLVDTIFDFWSLNTDFGEGLMSWVVRRENEQGKILSFFSILLSNWERNENTARFVGKKVSSSFLSFFQFFATCCRICHLAAQNVIEIFFFSFSGASSITSTGTWTTPSEGTRSTFRTWWARRCPTPCSNSSWSTRTSASRPSASRAPDSAPTPTLRSTTWARRTLRSCPSCSATSSSSSATSSGCSTWRPLSGLLCL